MDAFVEENLKKAEEKAKKKREKKGVKSSTLYQAANTNTRNIENAPANNNPNSIAARANLNVDGTGNKKSAPPADSLAAKAGLVQQYNEEHGDVPSENSPKARKKYKK